MVVEGRNRDTGRSALADTEWPAVKADMERWLYGGEDDLSLTDLNARLVAGFHDRAN